MEDLLANDPKVINITETWLTSERNKTTADIKEYGFLPYHKIRKGRQKEIGGGVGVLVTADVKCKLMPTKDYVSFEFSFTRAPLSNGNFLLLIVV